MSNRHLSRSIVLQTLFEWDTNNEEGNGKTDAPEVILSRNIEEFATDSKDKPFMKRLLDGVITKQSDLDAVISKAAPEWPIDKIARVDRNILRLGLYELLFSDRKEVPAKVAINEAIELAKNFGGDSSGGFINGVIGGVYKELGEPGKDEVSTKNKKSRTQPLVPYELMPIDRKAGAVVYAEHDGDVYVALVHDVFGHWTLSKGGVEEGESDEEATVREIKEEMDLDIKIVEKLGENEYVASHPEKGKIRKHVSYYLAESPFTEVKLEEGKGGLDDARWFKLADILELNFYHDMLPIITKAINILLSLKK
ncbi:TPA: transcription antitermination factor NusB [Patescibacteria group bacterium]|nr:MAG: N utilization substance protein B-like protein [Parcubacteria group bacterium GW2011_GWD2_42_14]HCC04942.1 transcription antitermination factor NusB [Patescibacteria group bacterium]